MLPHVKKILEELNEVFDVEMTRLSQSKYAKSKNPNKKISTKYFFLHVNLRNIADGLFAVLETVRPEERMNILIELIKSLDKKIDTELDSATNVLIASVLTLAGYPIKISANLSILTPGGKTKEERAEKAMEILFSLSPLAKKTAKEQKITRPYDIKAFAYKPKQVIETNIQNVAAVELEVDNKYAEARLALRDYLLAIMDVLSIMYSDMKNSPKHVPAKIENKIDALFVQESEELFEMYYNLDILTYETFTSYTARADALFNKAQAVRKEFENMPQANMAHSSEERYISTIRERLAQALKALKTALNKLKKMAMEITSYASKSSQNEMNKENSPANKYTSPEVTKKKPLLHSKKTTPKGTPRGSSKEPNPKPSPDA